MRFPTDTAGYPNHAREAGESIGKVEDQHHNGRVDHELSDLAPGTLLGRIDQEESAAAQKTKRSARCPDREAWITPVKPGVEHAAANAAKQKKQDEPQRSEVRLSQRPEEKYPHRIEK